MKKIVEMRFGSHLYGTATPASDTDLKAIYLPTARDILLQRVKPVISAKTKADERAKNGPDDVDRETFSLQKYLELVAGGQTVALDMLFAPQLMCSSTTDAWDQIQRNRHRLLSKRCQAFIGYCRQQANKYGIKGSRMAAARAARDFFADALTKHPTSTKVDLVRAEVSAALEGLEHVEFINREMPGPTIVLHLSVCNRQVPYTASIKTAFDVYDRLFAEYGQRALAAERNEGVDWKALSHAVRVGSQAIELLTTGHITFPRPEAKYLLAIKTGHMAYQPVSERIEQLLEEVEAAALESSLPDAPDQGWIDDFVAFQHTQVMRGLL